MPDCKCRDLYRYRQFLGIQREQQNIAEEAEKLKMGFRAGTDVASPDNLSTIEAAKREGTPADRCACAAMHPLVSRRDVASCPGAWPECLHRTLA